MRAPYLPDPNSITPTKDRRIRIAGYGPANWRTEYPTEEGFTGWDITGPAYATKTEALANVDYALWLAFGEPMPARVPQAGLTTTYAIHVQVLTHDGDYHGSVQVPTFYLDARVQGMTDAAGAAIVARAVVNPLGLIPQDDLMVTAVPVATDQDARDWSGEFDIDGNPIPLSAFAGYPGHIGFVPGTGRHARTM